MKNMVFWGLLSLVLVGCSNEPTKEEIAEIKETESRFLSMCYAKHLKDRKYKECDAEFEGRFGYPYKESYAQKALDEIKGK